MPNVFGINVPSPTPAAQTQPFIQGPANYNGDYADQNGIYGNPQVAPQVVAPNTGTAPPAPFVPPPAVQTPAQAASGFIPPPNLPLNNVAAQPTKGAPQMTIPASNFGQQAMINGTPFNDNLGAFSNLMPLFANVPAGKGFSKGPSDQQNPAQPDMSTMPGTAGNPNDFHTQLQDFINSGLLGGSQRLQG